VFESRAAKTLVTDVEALARAGCLSLVLIRIFFVVFYRFKLKKFTF